MAGDQLNDGNPSDRQPRGAEFVTTRAAVEWHFGDILDRVAVDYPVSKERLASILTAVECEARERKDRLNAVGETVRSAAPGEILMLPSRTWARLERARSLSESDAVAARATHRRFARTLATDEGLAELETDLFVFCYRDASE